LELDGKPFLGLTDSWLKADILRQEGAVCHLHTGTLQAGAISPILANIYLHFALDHGFEGVIKPRCRGQAYLIRYAVDFACTFQY
jgi:RNA-directed DNA polymerase